jgi:hypothetical protein
MNKIILRIRRHKLLLVLPVVLLILAAASVLLTKRKPSAEALFKQVVIDPIPESVKDIKASIPLDKRERGHTEHTYILRFAISREDLSKIITSGNFVEQKIIYKATDQDLHLLNLSLDYIVPNSNVVWPGVTLYATNRDVPDWFDLPQWNGFKAYYTGTEQPVDMYVKAHVLLYNERLGRAYFIDQEVIGEGSRGGFLWWILQFFRVI